MIRALSPLFLVAAAVEALQLPDPRGYQSIGWFLVVAAAVLGALLAAVYYALGSAERWQTLKRGNSPQTVNVTNTTQRRDVRVLDDLVTKGECARTHNDLDQNRRDFRQEHKEQHESLKISDAAQWEKINEHDSAIRDLPDRIIATLRNTGALKP